MKKRGKKEKRDKKQEARKKKKAYQPRKRTLAPRGREGRSWRKTRVVGRGPLAVMMTLRADGQRPWHVSWGNILVRRHDHVPRSVCGLQCRVQLVSGYSFIIDCVLTSLPAIKENKHVIFRGHASYLVTYLSAFILAASRKRYVIGCHHSIHACRYKVSHQHSKTGRQVRYLNFKSFSHTSNVQVSFIQYLFRCCFALTLLTAWVFFGVGFAFSGLRVQGIS